MVKERAQREEQQSQEETHRTTKQAGCPIWLGLGSYTFTWYMYICLNQVHYICYMLVYHNISIVFNCPVMSCTYGWSLWNLFAHICIHLHTACGCLMRLICTYILNRDTYIYIYKYMHMRVYAYKYHGVFFMGLSSTMPGWYLSCPEIYAFYICAYKHIYIYIHVYTHVERSTC